MGRPARAKRDLADKRPKAGRKPDVDPILARCREIFNSRESVTGAYPGDQKDYDKAWSGRLIKIMEYIEGGDRNISEIFARFRARRMSGKYPVGAVADFTSFGQSVRLLARSGYVAYRHSVADAVIAASRDDTVAVVELGSGNGESTFTIWGEGRLRRPQYYACEFSEAGRRTTRLLAALDPRLKMEVRFFDYRAPSFEGIKFEKGHAIVFSTHSIEQVDQIPRALIDRLCEIAPSVTGLHFEPIGWQFARDPTADFVVRHRERCLELNYNENFWALLKQMEAENKIDIVEAIPYFFGFEYNPPCKILWKKRE